MGLFDLFKSKSSGEGTQQELIEKIIRRYFNGSREQLKADVNDLLEVTKYDISFEQMSALLICSLGYHGVNANWSEKILNQMKQLCSRKLPDVELKWLFDYCDLHYIHKNPGKEFILLSEMAGRQTGRPATHEVKKIHRTGHLLLLKELLGDSFYAFKHYTETSKYPTYMWAERQLYLNDKSKIVYAVPFLCIRRWAKEDVAKFNNTIDLLNKEFYVNIDDVNCSNIINYIKLNGFWEYNPDFDINFNFNKLTQLYVDITCLARFIYLFGDNVVESDFLPFNVINIQSASKAINDLANEMADEYMLGKIGK